MLWFKKVTLVMVSAVFLFTGFAFAAPADPVVVADPNLGLVIDPNIVIDPNYIAPLPTPVVGNVQQVVIPYSNFGDGWASGLAIHNMSDELVYYQIGFRTTAGAWLDGDVFSIAAYAQRIDLLEAFDDGDGDIPATGGQYAVYIRTLNKDNQFAATLFVGNTGDLKGFGFQSFFSVQQSMTLIDDPSSVSLVPIDDTLLAPIGWANWVYLGL